MNEIRLTPHSGTVDADERREESIPSLQEARYQLEQSLAKYIDLYDFAPAAILILTAKGAIREANLAGDFLAGGQVVCRWGR